MNFALKSDDEQSAIVYAFQNFLNSLDFSCQIVMQSRNLNITPYLDKIRALEKTQPNELLKAQISSYEDFIQGLVESDSIMVKSFYVVVPYSLAEILGVGASMKGSGLFSLFSKKKAGENKGELNDEDFQKCKNQLWQRMEFLAMGLKRCGLDVIPLTTPELIELFWSIHHPNEAEIGYSPKILPELLR